MRFDERRHDLIAYFTEYRLRDEVRIKQVGDELDKLVGKVPDGKRLVLDFTAVQSVSSEIIGVLVGFNRNCRVAKVDLRFRNLSSAVMEVLRVAPLDNVYQIADGNYSYGEDDGPEIAPH